MKKKVKKLICALTATAFLLSPVISPGESMQSFFNAMGATSNATGPGAYSAQTRNIITGGSLFVRAPVKNYQLMNFQPPSIRAGCGGIDLFAGSFSFINKDQFVAMVRNIASNAAGHAFQLAIDAMSPMIGADLKHFQDLLQKANAQNINSCEAGSALVDGAVGLFQQTQVHQARTYGVQQNDFPDASAATAGTGDEQSINNVNQEAGNDPAKKDQQPTGNIVWDALANDPSFGSDNDLRLLLMSITGTVVFGASTDSSPSSVQVQAGTGITLDSFLGDGSGKTTYEVLDCTDGYGVGQCLNMTTKTISQTGFRELITNRLMQIADNLASDQRGDPSDPAFVNATSVPIYKMLAVSTALQDSGLAASMIQASQDTIVAEYAGTYLRRLLKDLEHAIGAKAIKSDKVVADQLNEFKTKLAQLRQDTIALQQKAYTNQIATNDLATQIMQMEKAMMTSMPQNLASNIAWARANSN